MSTSTKQIPKKAKQTTTPQKGLDLKTIYDFKPDDLTLDINVIKYSNLAYVQVSPRDVCIDFLEMPGVKRDGRMIVSGTRIFMSHIAGQKLAEALGRVISEVKEKGGIEQLNEAKI